MVCIVSESVVVWQLMQPWSVTRDNTKIVRRAVYTFRGRWANNWRDGRVLLAGDAAHQMPPFMGQGFNSGVRDTVALAWLLERVLRGHSPPTLLDSYTCERLPHVQAFIELAVKLGAVLQETDSTAAAARDARFAQGAQMFDFPQPQLGPGHRVDGPPPLGTIFPQPYLADGRLMDEAVGQRFAIVGQTSLLAAKMPDAVRLDGVGADWLAERGLGAAILRPDRYVFDVA